MWCGWSLGGGGGVCGVGGEISGGVEVAFYWLHPSSDPLFPSPHLRSTHPSITHEGGCALLAKDTFWGQPLRSSQRAEIGIHRVP